MGSKAKDGYKRSQGAARAAQMSAEELLRVAIKSGDVAKVLGAIAMGGSEVEKYAALAAKHPHPQVLAAVLEAGAKVDVEYVVDSGELPLIAAAKAGRDENIDVLLRFGADVSQRDQNGVDALMIAALNDKASTVRLLLARGAQPMRPHENGYDALALAASEGSVECVKILLPLSDPRRVDSDGMDALMLAVGSPATMELLMDVCDPLLIDHDRKSALRYAVEAQDVASALLLIPRSDLWSKGPSDMTPLAMAAALGQEEMARALAEAMIGTRPDMEAALEFARASGHSAQSAKEISRMLESFIATLCDRLELSRGEQPELPTKRRGRAL